MASFEKASPALKEILLKIYRSENPIEVDHCLHEFGSVEYHIQSSASDPQHIYLSISTPLLSQGILLSYGLPRYTTELLNRTYSDVVELEEPAREGFQLTLRINLGKISKTKDAEKLITKISSVQAIVLSSQLKEMLKNVNSQEVSRGPYRPIKLVYHPREPFFVVKQEASVITIFPIRFKEDSDVIIATSFFQELMDVGSSGAFAKAPPCHWSPIPPLELRGEPIEELSTNGGFISFEISSRHVEGKKLEKMVWSLLNFYAFLKYHVKSTKGFIQRRLRKRLESLVEVLHKASTEEDHIEKAQGRTHKRKLITSSRFRFFRKRFNFKKKMKHFRSKIKIHGLDRFRRRWLRIPTLSSVKRYAKLR
ncbi:Arp2/3 complex 34 kDa subunit [Heracleum sosnowskyi]|uniref:Arp2/3 complex 34 kDa subunit n=1 Tax=Heracleum sosnowskyi TaxID=360622 RepID=A0AAD8IRA5_9APIA|nr:Arp2/3 complex 34 kDa subunit [Heracleum sosnowskyi]